MNKMNSYLAPIFLRNSLAIGLYTAAWYQYNHSQCGMRYVMTSGIAMWGIHEWNKSLPWYPHVLRAYPTQMKIGMLGYAIGMYWMPMLTMPKTEEDKQGD